MFEVLKTPGSKNCVKKIMHDMSVRLLKDHSLTWITLLYMYVFNNQDFGH